MYFMMGNILSMVDGALEPLAHCLDALSLSNFFMCSIRAAFCCRSRSNCTCKLSIRLCAVDLFDFLDSAHA